MYIYIYIMYIQLIIISHTHHDRCLAALGCATSPGGSRHGLCAHGGIGPAELRPSRAARASRCAGAVQLGPPNFLPEIWGKDVTTMGGKQHGKTILRHFV